MKINKLKINSFGKIKNKEINLKNNINIIYGKNESGKSTILKFIENSLYGTSKNKNGKEISDYDKFKPWDSDEFSGKLQYELDNGEKYEIYREFGKKNPKIFNENGEDISKQYNIDKTRGNEFFYEQTKIDEKLFLSTSVTMQQDVKLDKNIQNILIQKITNLVGTGEDNISYKKAIEKLNKKQLEEIGTERSKEKPLNIVSQEIMNLNNEKNNLKKEKNNYELIEEEKNIINNEIKNEELKCELIKEIKIIKENEKLENEKIKINENINKENLEKINLLKLEKNNLIEKNKNVFENKLEENKIKNKLKNKLIVSIILFLIINIFMFIIMSKEIFCFVFFITIAIEIIICFDAKNKNKKMKNEKNIYDEKIKEIKNKINNYENEIKLLEENNNYLINEINKIKNENINKNNLEKEKIKNKYLKKINLNEINFLLNSQNINYELELIQNKIYNYKIKENKIEFQKESIEKELNRLVDIEEKLDCLNNKYKKLKSKNQSIEIVKSVLSNSYEKMKQNISPKFTDNLSKTIRNITDGRYCNVKYSDEKGILVELHNGNYVNADILSVGTIEQLYLSLRLAIMEEVCNEKVPIILDEVFAYYDDERLKNILKYINELYKERQIMILTCTNREKEILKKLFIEFNLVEI